LAVFRRQLSGAIPEGQGRFVSGSMKLACRKTFHHESGRILVIPSLTFLQNKQESQYDSHKP
jgi:hypothetical protein